MARVFWGVLRGLRGSRFRVATARSNADVVDPYITGKP